MHFVVPATQGPRSLADPGALPALVEARLAGRPAAAAAAPAPPAACGDGEEEEEDEDGGGASPYIAPASVFDSPRHLLHGVLHQNGFGHLLRVNGREGGSAALSGARALPAGDPKRGAHGRLNLRPSMWARPWQGAGPPRWSAGGLRRRGCGRAGRQLMDIWDQLCRLLRARVVSVEDVSNKARPAPWAPSPLGLLCGIRRMSGGAGPPSAHRTWSRCAGPCARAAGQHGAARAARGCTLGAVGACLLSQTADSPATSGTAVMVGKHVVGIGWG